MIEKVMKAVKRNSKRRSVNITIGAVVGFLLSCTAVMGAAAVEIEGNDEKFEVTSTAIEGNTFEDKIYTNNGEITAGEDTGISVTGKPANSNLSIINNGSIEAISSGIYMKSNMTGNITNNGTISGQNGIKAEDAQSKGDIINNGNIESNNGHGIYIYHGTVNGDMVNNGIITTKLGYNLFAAGTLKGNIINKGMLINNSNAAIGFGGAIGEPGNKKNVQNDGFISVSSENASTGIEMINGTLTGNIYNTGAIETEGTGSESSSGILVPVVVKGNIENTGTISSANSGTGKSYGINITETGTIEGIKNDGIINSSSKTDSSLGIYNLGTITDIENNGIINSTSDEGYVCGIYYDNSKMQENIANRGLIALVTDSSRKSAVGIGAFGTTKKVLNTGYINSNNNKDYGTYGITTSSTGKVNEIINNGNIYAIGTDNVSGISVGSTPEGGTSILNNGLINSTKTGINVRGEDTLVKSFTNGGVIYGKTYAIYMEKKNLGEGIKGNYGLLIGEGNSIGDNNTGIPNYGMTFSVGTEGNAGKYFVQATEEYSGDGRTIVNADLEGDNKEKGEATGTKSVLSSALDNDKKYIINGIDKTLKVVDTDKTLKNSVINAYGTAMVMNAERALTAEGTIFNGGVNGAATISLAGNNTLNLSENSIVNGNMEINGGNNTLDMSESSVNGKMAVTGDRNNLTIVESYLNDEMTITGSNNTLDMKKSSMNGKVATTGDNNNLTIADSGINDELTVKGNSNTLEITDSNLNKNIAIDGEKNVLTISGDNTFINGDMEAKGTDNTVNLAGKSTDGSSLNMFNKVTGFEDMNIDNNVTFFENAEVTGVKNLTVAEDGTLNLRLKKDGEAEGGLANGVHAFSGNEKMEMKGLDKGGTLQFITNGIGEGVWIDTSNMDIKNMVVKTNSVLDGFKFDDEGTGLTLKAADSLAGMNKSGDKVINSTENKIESSSNIGDSNDIFEHENFESIDGIYKGIYSSTEDNLNALRDLAMTDRNTGNLNEGMSKGEQMENLQAYLNEIYTQSPYALSSELSRRSAGMFRDIVTENMFRPNLNQWMIMGGLTHIDGGTKDTYYGEVYQLDGKNSLNTEADMKLTGAYALGKYGYSENVALGVTVGGNRSEAELSKSKVKGNSGYIGAFAENYRGNLTLKAGAGIQYSEYDADRSTVGEHSYNDKYSDMTYDIYLNGRYSNPVGENLFLEPYATLSYTYVDQEGTDEGSKALAIKTDSKSFEYTSAEVGVDLKKVIPHEKGKSTLSAGVSYTRLLNGADSDKLTGNFGGSDFDILVAGKNKHNLGLNAKYTLELESGVLFDVKGSYSFERDSHKDNARNRNKGEWMVGAGLGYKF